MATYNVLEWQTENALSSYPLAADIEVSDVLVDAKFTQFDNFIPILNHIKVDELAITLSITFDYGTNDNILFYKSSIQASQKYAYLRIYNSSGDRCMGSVTFGPGVLQLFNLFVGTTITTNTKFSHSTVRSIPFKDAVYRFDDNYGELLLARTTPDRTIFYNVSTELKTITFNAVGNHQVSGELKGLRQINRVKPFNNNINLASNDVIKINSFNSASLTIDLVAGDVSNAFTIPTLNA